jgi:hypothetical protein
MNSYTLYILHNFNNTHVYLHFAYNQKGQHFGNNTYAT